MNEIKIDLSKCIDNFKLDKDKVKQYGGYKKITIDLSKENMRLAFENHNLQSKIGKAIECLDNHFIFDDENGEYYQTHTFDKCNAKELYDILKEDK